MNDSFILYTSYYALIEGLTDEQLGQLTRAIFLYARDGKVIKLEPVVRMAFAFIKDNIERNQDKYQAKCEKNRQIALERERKKREAREKADNTNVHERSRTCENNTNVHERSPYDNDNEYDNDNVDDNDVSKETIEPSKEGKSKNEFLTPEPAKEKKAVGIDCAAVKEYWNAKHDETNSSMRRLTLMSESRKVMLRARLRQCKGDVSMIYKAIDTAMASDFMNGNNGRGWTASFDWIFGNENNFAKTLEGYDDKPARPPKGQQPAASQQAPSIGERYQQAQHQSQQDKDHELIARYLGMVEMLEKNPNHLCKGALVSAYEAGELSRLGIDWKPNK